MAELAHTSLSLSLTSLLHQLLPRLLPPITPVDQSEPPLDCFLCIICTNWPHRFEQIFRLLLDQLQPVCVSEQKFLMSFFHFAKPEGGGDGAGEGMGHADIGEEAEDQVDSARNQRASSEPMDPGLSAAQGDVYNVLGQLFSLLLPEIESFITFGEKLDS